VRGSHVVTPASLPTLSIVSLSFNQARFLADCVDSVAAQKAEGVEYIVVDPGSSDGSREILQGRIQDIDSLILEPDNGPADGLNRGFSRATGELFGYINADDRLAPGAIRFVRGYFASHPSVDVLCGSLRIIDEHGRSSIRARTSDRFDVRRYAARLCNIAQQATFFRRRAFDLVGGFNPGNRVAWDGELLADLALAHARFANVRKVLGEFRVYRGTISSSEGYLAKLDTYYLGVEKKLRDRGIEPYTPTARTLGKLAYKLNLWRYAECLLVR